MPISSQEVDAVVAGISQVFLNEIAKLDERLTALESSPSKAGRGLNHEKFADGLHDYIRRALAPLAAEVKALRDQPTLEYLGPFEEGTTYRKGNFVTHGGSLWHANRSTMTRPGDGSGWTLAVKRGKDAAA